MQHDIFKQPSVAKCNLGVEKSGTHDGSESRWQEQELDGWLGEGAGKQGWSFFGGGGEYGGGVGAGGGGTLWWWEVVQVQVHLQVRVVVGALRAKSKR